MVRLAVLVLLVLWHPTALFAQGLTHIVDDDGAGTFENCDAATPAFSTVGAAIAASVSGDTVLVCPGTYLENINFQGKAIVVRALRAFGTVTLDGNAVGSVVTFNSGESGGAVLEGFTIRNGFPSARGGGISIDNSSPIIRFNTIVDNRACLAAGISIQGGAPLIDENFIHRNTQAGCSGGTEGGGIAIVGVSSALIRRNTIVNNSGVMFGGGISLNGAGSPTIERNDIRDNDADFGGGISILNHSSAIITGNVIARNRAQSGGGLMAVLPSVAQPVLVNNTFADNETAAGSAVVIDAFAENTAMVFNNNIVARPGETALSCGNDDLNAARFQYNNVHSVNAASYAGACTDHTGRNGNISADPRFLNRALGDLRLASGSPSIDAGLGGVVGMTPIDMVGVPRPLDGNRDGVAVVDIGAFEMRSRFVRHVQIDTPLAGVVGSSLVIYGWAVDGRGINTGVDAVHIWAHPEDGTAPIPLGVAEYGLPRSDVGVILGDFGYLNAGFRLTVTRPLSAGAYLIIVYARSTVTGTFDTTGQVRVTVRSSPFSFLDSPRAGETIRGPLRLSGWALDIGSLAGTGVDAVHVYAFPVGGGAPVFLGAADYGLPRPDVAIAFGDPRFSASGWELAATLPSGQYQLAVYARSYVAEAFNQVIVRAVTVIGSQPQLFIDTPVENASVAQPFTISGWAIDLSAGSGPGMDAVHIYAYPNPGSGQPPILVGAATYGLARPDVAMVFGNAQFTNSGYTITASGLPAGRYMLAVHGRSTVTNTFNALQTVTIDLSSGEGKPQRRIK